MFFDFQWLGNYNNFWTTNTVLTLSNWIVRLISAYFCISVMSDAADAIKFYMLRI